MGGVGVGATTTVYSTVRRMTRNGRQQSANTLILYLRRYFSYFNFIGVFISLKFPPHICIHKYVYFVLLTLEINPFVFKAFQISLCSSFIRRHSTFAALLSPSRSDSDPGTRLDNEPDRST